MNNIEVCPDTGIETAEITPEDFRFDLFQGLIQQGMGDLFIHGSLCFSGFDGFDASLPLTGKVVVKAPVCDCCATLSDHS